MKTDLDALMEERNLDALLVSGASQNNPTMYYIASGAHVGERTLVVKQRGQPPLMIVDPMERDEAAQSGLEVRLDHDFGRLESYKAAKGNAFAARLDFYARVLRQLDISGRLGVYGRDEGGLAFTFYSQLAAQLAPQVEIVGETNDSIFAQAQLTKDAHEVEHIRQVAEKTLRIVDNIKDLLAGHRHDGQQLVKRGGEPLRIGDVHNQIQLQIAQAGLEAPHGFIFSIGRDAAVPHSHGTPTDPLRLGTTIIFDIYPRPAGGGYFYDFTRTWCLGHVPDDVQAVYDDVAAAFEIGSRAMQPGVRCDVPQQAVIDYFNAKGHPTVGGTSGYFHGLGHSIGLSVHEPPTMSTLRDQHYTFQPGMTMTIEPGLYYPDREIGVRLEDFVWLNPGSNRFETIGDYTKELLIPVKPLAAVG